MGEIHLHSAILFGSLLSVLLSDVTSSTLLQSLFEKDVTCFKVTNQKEALSVGVDSNSSRSIKWCFANELYFYFGGCIFTVSPMVRFLTCSFTIHILKMLS